MFHSRTLRIVLVAAGILAFSASAAQARPLGLGYTGHLQTQSSTEGYQTTHHLYGAQIMSTYYRPTQSQAGRAQVMSPAVDPANAQQVPVVVTQAQPVAASDSGFNWTAAILGAGIASAVLLLAGATASRMKPRRVAL